MHRGPVLKEEAPLAHFCRMPALAVDVTSGTRVMAGLVLCALRAELCYLYVGSMIWPINYLCVGDVASAFQRVCHYLNFIACTLLVQLTRRVTWKENTWTPSPVLVFPQLF